MMTWSYFVIIILGVTTCHTLKLSFPTIRESVNRENQTFSNLQKCSPTKYSHYYTVYSLHRWPTCLDNTKH